MMQSIHFNCCNRFVARFGRKAFTSVSTRTVQTSSRKTRIRSGRWFHGVSVFYCMTTSLANNGAVLGTLGFHEAKVRELCDKARFSSVRRVPLENLFNNLYEANP